MKLFVSKTRTAIIAFVAVVCAAGCQQSQEPAARVNDVPQNAPQPVPAESKRDPIEDKLDQLAKAHSATTIPKSWTSWEGTVTTLDFQEFVEDVRGKSVAFVGNLTNVYRAKKGYMAAFSSPEDVPMPYNLVLRVAEQEARKLVERAHSDEYWMTTYIVIAQLESVEVTYDTSYRAVVDISEYLPDEHGFASREAPDDGLVEADANPEYEKLSGFYGKLVALEMIDME